MPWVHIRVYHALLNLISLTIIALFSYQVDSPYGQVKGLFTVASSLAISSNCTTLKNGQYGIIINALLIGVYWLIKKYKNIWAGLLLGMAMIKPNVSALYFFVLVVRKRIQAIISFFLYIFLASINIWLLTKVDPISMIGRIIFHFSFTGKQSMATRKNT